MTIYLLKREIENLKMLGKIAKHHGSTVFFWSLMDGIARRLHLGKIYEKTHNSRHEACKKYLKKKYYNVIEKYKDYNFKEIMPIGELSPVWRYWHQGRENAPYPVNVTLDSLDKKTRQHPVYVLDANNYKKYVRIPPYIEKKFANKQMNIAVFSDFLRLALLKEYGGIWLDSTFFVSDILPTQIDDLSFFSIKQGNRRKWVVTRDLWSVCMLGAGAQNPLISFCYDFLKEYWKNEITPIAYLMTDCIIAIGYEEIPIIKHLIDSVPNNNFHSFDFLGEFRNKKANINKINKMRKNTFVFQLSYKYNWVEKNNKGELTNFGALISG